MADYLTTDTELTSIADAIRVKGGTTAALTYPSEFISAINAIETTPPVQDKTISPTEAKQTVFPDSGKLLSSVTVNAISSTYVGSGIATRSAANVTISGPTTTVPSGYYSSAVTKTMSNAAAGTQYSVTFQPQFSVNASGVVHVAQSIGGSWRYVTSAGYIDTSAQMQIGCTGSSDYQLSTQAGKTVTPTESVQTAVAASKYTLGDVKVAAISSTYIGSAVTTHSAADVTISGPTVSVPSGYYASAVSTTIPNGSVLPHTKSFDISIGTISLNSNSGLISVARASIDSTYRVTTSSGYIAALETTGDLTFEAASATYQLSTQAAQTITPTTTNQTIAAGKYLTGAQTIKGDSNLVAGNIAAGVSIFGIQGTHSGGIDTSDATLNSSAQMLDGVTAYAKGSKYTGNIPTKTAADLTASGSKVTVPSGYYAATATKAISGGTATTPATTISVTPGITVSAAGLITATVNSSKSITPTVSAGYISSGTAGTVTASGSKTSQLSTQGTATITPTESSQTAVASGKYTIGVVSVGAISSDYVGSNIAQNSAADLTASGSKVTVPSGYYAAVATKAVSAGSATTPATTITATPTITVSAAGLITATVNSSKSITPTVSAGYISSGTAGTVTASGSKTSQLSTQAAATITPTKSEQTAVASGKYTTGIVKVAAIPSQYIVPSGSTTLTSNSTYDVTDKAEVVVQVPSDMPETQTKTVNPTESEQTVEPDSGKLLSAVTVTAVSSNYVGSNIAQHSAADLTASGSKVTVPSGYYAAVATKAVAAGSATTPATTITATPTISVSAAGLITATVSSSKSITPTVSAGYVSSGTAGTVTASGSKTSQLSTQAAATITPTESEQTAVASGKYTTGIVKVAAISSNYVGSNIATHSSADLTASGSTITAPAGYYAAAAAKSISAGSATTPATTISVTPTISVSSSGLITATVSSSKSITPTVSAGYVSAGTAGTVTASGSKTSQLSTQAAQTIMPSTTDQTIPSGKYLTGTQTILGDANLVASNILKNVTIFGVTGNAEIVHYDTYDGSVT